LCSLSVPGTQTRRREKKGVHELRGEVRAHKSMERPEGKNPPQHRPFQVEKIISVERREVFGGGLKNDAPGKKSGN